MPLAPGNSRFAIGNNIREMVASGHPQRQAVAAALNNARLHPRSEGGFVAPGGFSSQQPEHFDMGGMPSSAEMSDWVARREATDSQHESGLFNSAVPGRTDKLNTLVPAGAYVIPADVVSGLGEGNTMAGSAVLDRMFHTNPFGISGNRLTYGRGVGIPHPPAPYKEPRAGGGKATGGHVPIVAAGGEYVVHPDAVKRLGHGNMKKGHEILDHFVVHVRNKTAGEMKKLPGPKGMKK